MIWKKEVPAQPALQEDVHFFYDSASRPTMVAFREKMYTFLRNLQGDITGILDNRQNLVVEYGYDAWGRITGEISKMAGGGFTQADAEAAQVLMQINPFRYRGYVYDQETDLYYLRSRYYNPNLGRFVDPDEPFGQDGSILEHNKFCYCKNSCTIHSDADGFFEIGVTYDDVVTAGRMASADGAFPAADAIALIWIVGKLIFGPSTAYAPGVAVTEQVTTGAQSKANSKEKEREKARAPFFLAVAIGEGPVVPVSLPMTLVEAKATVNAGITGETIKAAMKQHNVVDTNEALHYGIYASQRRDVRALVLSYTKELVEDRPMIPQFPHFHITRRGRYKKLHFWYFPQLWR